MVSHNIVRLVIFTFSGMDFSSSKSFIYLPRYFWFISQRCSFDEPFRNRNEDKRRKGVVGSRGMITPKTPKVRDNIPRAVSSVFFIGIVRFFVNYS